MDVSGPVGRRDFNARDHLYTKITSSLLGRCYAGYSVVIRDRYDVQTGHNRLIHYLSRRPGPV